MKRLAFFTLILLLGCSVHSGAAQDVTLEHGFDYLERGAYKEAIRVFSALLEKEPTARLALDGLLRARIDTGDYAAAEKRAADWLASHAADGEIRMYLAETRLVTGRYAEAAAEYERVAREAKGALLMRARLGQGEALREMGKEDEAAAALTEIVRLANSDSPREAEELAAIARALHWLERYHDANEVFQDARDADDEYITAYIWQGDLLNEKYQYGDAASLFQDALKINPNATAALLGLAESKRLTSNVEPLDLTMRALAVNPNHAGALTLRAWLALEDEQPQQAAGFLDKALAVNPNFVDAMAVRAAIYYLSDRKELLEAETRKALAVNPRAGRFFATLAHFAVMNRRYSDAVDFGRRAVEIAPKLWSARTELGIQLLRVGRMEEGRAELERAFAGDTFNVWAKNSLDLLDSMKDYRDTIRGPFLIRTAPTESEVLSAYAADLLEDAHRALTAKYRFTPKAPITVEIFPNHEDFAVRSLGLPGLGALGVCFGQVIAMDSPSARRPGEFNWGSTLWHEYMHVISLQITDHRIPRWFSEGLSVYEERKAKSGWGDKWSFERVGALLGGRLVKINDLDAAFTRPRTPDSVGLAYFQASLVCDFIEEKHGFEAILKMLELYKQGMKTPQVLEKALDRTPEGFDIAFSEYVRQKAGRYADVLGGGPEVAKATSREALLALAKIRPDDFFVNLRLGNALKTEKPAEALAYLRRAVELFPYYGGEGNAYETMAEIYEARGDKAAAAAALAELAKVDDTSAEALGRLARLRVETGDKAGALEALMLGFYIAPFDAGLHKLAGDLYLEMGRSNDAVREFRVRVSLNPPDMAEARYDLANALLAAGNRAEARREVLRALEIAPGFEKAQELLLRLRSN